MPTPEFHRELATLLDKHGLKQLPAGVAVSPAATPGSAVASYIKEIITGDQAFDEKMLGRVLTSIHK